MASILRYQYLAIIWSLIVLVLCDMPFPGAGGGGFFFEGFDKLVHTGFFFVLSILIYVGDIIRKPDHNRLLITLKILFISVVFGGGIEISQLEVFTYRSAEWWDFFADMTGTAMAIFAYFLLFRKPLYEKSI